MQEFVYHRVPEVMEGTIIYPLNVLKKEKPSFYDEYVKKYQGRESLLGVNISPLKCLWGDVIFFSPIHPNEILREIEAAGFPKHPKTKWFKVPLSNLKLENLAINMSEDKFELFKLDMLSKVNYLPEETKVYYQTCFQNNKNPLILAHAPHLLYKGVLDVRDLEVIEV